ncbi:MAG: DUF772 domain-containing protein [Lachnoclostridium sp.]
MISYKQLSLADIFQNCQEKFDEDKYSFLSLLEQNINLDELIPVSFRHHFYASTGRHRKYHLESFIWALFIQRIFSIPTDSLLILFLKYSRELADNQFRMLLSCFKQNFLLDSPRNEFINVGVHIIVFKM